LHGNEWDGGAKKKQFEETLDKYSGMMDNDAIAQMDGLLRFYFKVDPDKLSDEEFSQRWAQLNWVLKKRGSDEQ
jgi:hypothetical protein